MAFGKWLGGGLGWALGGPIGGIIGFLFGSMVDNMNSGKYELHPPRQQTTREGDFNISLLILSASVMNADGKVLRAELDYMKQFLLRQYGKDKAEQMVLALREILKKEYSLRQVCLQIQMNMPHPSRLQLMHFLLGIAMADRQLHPEELDTIRRISAYLNVSEADMQSILAMYVKDEESAYKILGIDSSATDDEVKRAYRRMALKYHPDKVAHLGDDLQKAAKEKFQEVQQAYEKISRQRGMK